MADEVTAVEQGSGRAALGRTLRYLREKAGKSLSQLASETRYDKSYLYRLEVSQRLSKLAVMEDLDRHYETGGCWCSCGRWLGGRCSRTSTRSS